MPFQIPNPIPAVPPPPPSIGAIAPPIIMGGIPSAPLNIGMGSAAAVGSAALTTSQLGVEVTEVSYGVNLVMQLVKMIPWVRQDFWWPAILLALGIGAFLVLTQGDVVTSLAKGFAAAFQAAITYHSFHIAGVGILPSAPDNQPAGG